MRYLLAGVLGAGCVALSAPSSGDENETWTYHDCVQDCRDNLPPNTTLQKCIIDKNCKQHPQPRRTYQDCIERCESQIPITGQTLQQCVARFVCSQYPRK